MRIDNIDIRNTLGVRSINVDLDTPITIFAGGNGAGKSSVHECVRMALGEDPARVALKKEFGALVTEGERKGMVAVTLGGEAYGIAFPDGKRSGLVELPDALQYVVNPQAFAELNPDQRRTFLFALTRCAPTTAAVKDMLLKRGCDATKFEKMSPLLKSGFPAAAEFAKEEALQSKRDWKAITNEVYGAQKAEDWEADKPSHDANKLAALGTEIEALDLRIETHATSVGVLQQKQVAYTQWQQEETKRAERAKSLPALEAKLALDLTELENWEAKVTDWAARVGDGPRVGLIHDLAKAVSYLIAFQEVDTPSDDDIAAQAALTAYEQQHGVIGASGDPAAPGELKKATDARDLMKRSVDNDRRDIAAAQAADSGCAEPPEAVLAADIDAARAALTTMRAKRNELDKERTAQDALATATRLADDKTKKAAEHHADVVAWLKIADAVSPDGIPGEILANALKPINDRMAASAENTTWMQPAIGTDMVITAAGRPYPLLCESEKWRTDAIIAEAIAHLSDLRLLSLDRMDVLEVNGRSELLGWLDDLAVAGQLDTALVFATLKAAPTNLPDTMRAHWIQGGAVAEPPAALKQAA